MSSVSHLLNRLQKLTIQAQGRKEPRASFVAIFYTMDNEGQTEEEKRAEAEQIRQDLEAAAQEGIETILYLPFVEAEG